MRTIVIPWRLSLGGSPPFDHGAAALLNGDRVSGNIGSVAARRKAIRLATGKGSVQDL
jgi:hypothetical protein